MKYDLRNPIIYNETMKKIFEDDSDIISDFDVKMVGEKELLLWYQKDIFKGRYLTGEYIFWNKLGENQFELIDLKKYSDKWFGSLIDIKFKCFVIQ